jgi:hypothetical protein
MTASSTTLFAALLLGTLGGCAASISPYARATAGRIGCPAEHIDLGEVHDGEGAPEAWVASCGHAAYACSSNGDPRRPNTRVICSPLGRPRVLSYAR